MIWLLSLLLVSFWRLTGHSLHFSLITVELLLRDNHEVTHKHGTRIFVLSAFCTDPSTEHFLISLQSASRRGYVAWPYFPLLPIFPLLPPTHFSVPLIPSLFVSQQAVYSKRCAVDWNVSKLVQHIKIKSLLSNSRMTWSTHISTKWW